MKNHYRYMLSGDRPRSKWTDARELKTMRPKSRIVFFAYGYARNFIVNFRIGLSTHIGSALQGDPRAVPPAGNDAPAAPP